MVYRRRALPTPLFCIGLLTACCMLLPRCADAAQRPNVLLIVVDDMNNALGCYGHPLVQSPSLDRLAERGVRFDRAYCNYPVCNASRTSLLSGRRPETTEVYSNGVDPRINLGERYQFLPEYFRAHGYHTVGVGKIPHTPEHTASMQWDFYEDPQHRPELGFGADEEGGGKKKDKKSPAAKPKRDFRELPDEEQPDGIAARMAVKFMEGPHEVPFFLAVGLHRPHGPRVAPQKYFDLYPRESLPLLEEPSGHSAGIPQIAVPPQFYPDWTEAKWRNEWQTYFACATFMDAQVGVLLDAMDRLELWDNTVVLFVSDHGVHLGEHGGFWGKVSLMEESVRVPLIVASPGSQKGSASPRLVEMVDIFSTLTEQCGLPPQSGQEGTSFAPLLVDPQRPWKKAAFAVARRGKELGHSVRTERYTFIEWPDGSLQLYDYRHDPHEYVNLAADPQHADTLARLQKTLHNGWQAVPSPTPAHDSR